MTIEEENLTRKKSKQSKIVALSCQQPLFCWAKVVEGVEDNPLGGRIVVDHLLMEALFLRPQSDCGSAMRRGKMLASTSKRRK